MHTTLFLFYAGLARLGHAAYSVQDNYNAGNWVNMFNFDTVRVVRPGGRDLAKHV